LAERERRDLRGGLAQPPEDGGLEEFCEFTLSLARSCALSARKARFAAASSSNVDPNSAN
jgi:hypothetical protein